MSALAALLCASSAHAVILEEVHDVPVSVKTMYGQVVQHTIKVTVFHDSSRDQAPYLVLNHGRPANSEEFATMGRVRYSDNARYFVRQGFAVLVPTRVGYGETGGPDVEYSGACDNRAYAPVFAAAADQTEAVLHAAADWPGVDAHRGLVVGQSYEIGRAHV